MKEMDAVDHSGNRFYVLARNIVFIVTIVAGMSAVYYGYIIGTESISKEWLAYCNQFKDPTEHFNCMALSLKPVAEFRKLLLMNLAIALILPSLFYVGTWLVNKGKRQ
jgi:hypothetical protein